jgi:hypothetical protein
MTWTSMPPVYRARPTKNHEYRTLNAIAAIELAQQDGALETNQLIDYLPRANSSARPM